MLPTWSEEWEAVRQKSQRELESCIQHGMMGVQEWFGDYVSFEDAVEKARSLPPSTIDPYAMAQVIRFPCQKYFHDFSVIRIIFYPQN